MANEFTTRLERTKVQTVINKDTDYRLFSYRVFSWVLNTNLLQNLHYARAMDMVGYYVYVKMDWIGLIMI